MAVELRDDMVRSMDIGKVFKDNHADINSMSFSDDCSLVITASDDDTVNIYNVIRGTRDKLLYNRDYGVENIKFSHHPNAFLCSTKKGKEHLIKYWSSYDNRIIHNFKGHTDIISSIDMNPKNDMFVSTARDKQMILWDLRQRSALGRMEYFDGAGPGMCTFDPTGSVFALVYPIITQNTTKNHIKLVSCDNYSAGPFALFEYECPEIKGIEFSDDGNHLLAYTVENHILLLDAIDGRILHTFRDFTNESGKVMATFSADSKYMITGCEKSNGLVLFDVKSRNKVHELRGHPKTPTCLAWSKEHILLISACQNVIFWVPDYSKLN